MPRAHHQVPTLRRTVATPLGEMVLAATPVGVCLCEFTDRPALAREWSDLERLTGTPALDGNNHHLSLLADELAAYFAGVLRVFTIALDTPGPPFHRAVWDRLVAVPYGSTTSYDDIARALNNPNARRAVGQANGANRVSIVVPCHRVIEKNGKLRGYGGGLPRKRWLLDHESLHAESPDRGPGRAAVTGSLFAGVPLRS